MIPRSNPPDLPDAVAGLWEPPAASGRHLTYDTRQAEVGDRVEVDGVAMTVWKVDAEGYPGKGGADGPLVWARVGRNGMGTVFDAACHEVHDIYAATPQRKGQP